MSIIIHEELGEILFKKGETVFKIIATASDGKNDVYRDVNMVISKEDYEKQMQTHIYTPLLYISPFLLRLAYLYECLNRTVDIPRDENFTFLFRYVGQREWLNWFTVYPVKNI